MPQLELLDFPSQIFWLIVTFSFLYIVLSNYTLPTISDVLQNRQQRISDDLDKAARLKQQAESAEEDFTSALVNARETANKTITGARKKVADEEAAQYAKLDAVFEKQAKEADERIRTALATIESEILPVTTQASSEIIKKLINKDIDQKKVEKVAKNFLEASASS